MKNVGIKLVSGAIGGMLVIGSVIVPANYAFASETVQENKEQEFMFTYEEIQSMENFFSNVNEKEFYNAFEQAIIETQSEFIDPSVATELLGITQQVQEKNTPVLRGKVTLTAKAGAKAIKAVMNKVGKKGWNAMLKKVESTTGTELVVLHWESITKFLDYAVDFNGDIEDALEDFLVKKAGFNRTIAHWVAKTFIFIVL